MFNPTLQKYDDGTEFTLAHAAISVLAGALIGTGTYLCAAKLEEVRYNRWFKKHYRTEDHLREES
jgi:hypothetical protein